MQWRVVSSMEISYSAMEDMGRNDRIQIETKNHLFTGTVCKSNRGGIRVLPDKGRRLHVIKTAGGHSSVHPDGGSLRSKRSEGRIVDIQVLEEQGDVKYDQRKGWTTES